MQILFLSWTLTECDQIPGIGVDPTQRLLNVVDIFLTEAEAPSLCCPLIWIMDIPPQTSLQIARQHSVVHPAMNLHIAGGSLVHEPFSPFHPNGTEAEQVVVP